MGLLTLAIYLGLSLTSDAIVADSVYSVGISICAYYIVASLSSGLLLPPDGVRVRAHRVRPGDAAR